MIGTADMGGSENFAVACTICPRCKGKGKEEPTMIAGKLVGGDDRYLCFRCRGAGWYLVGLITPKGLRPYRWPHGRYEVDVKFTGEGYSMTRVRVTASSPDEARRKAVAEYSRHVVAVGEPRVVTR